MNFKIEVSKKNEKGFWMEPYVTLPGFQTLDSAKMEVDRLIENFKSRKAEEPRRLDIKMGNRIQATKEYKPEE